MAVTSALILCGLTGCTEPAASPAAPSSPVPAATVSPEPIARIQLPAHPNVYFFGDSWTSGIAAARGQGFPFVVAAALGWKVERGPDSGGAGYVHTYDPSHPIFPTAARSAPPSTPT